MTLAGEEFGSSLPVNNASEVAKSVPISSLVQRGTSRQPSKKVRKLNEYAEGKGIKCFEVEDLVRDRVSKCIASARQLVKIGLEVGVIAAANSKKPRKYCATSVFADVQEQNYAQKVPIHATGIDMQTIVTSVLDEILNFSLERDVLPHLSGEPLFVHHLNFQFILKEEYGADVYPHLTGHTRQTKKKAKVYERHIDGSAVQFWFYPRGKVMVYTQTSRRPHRLATEQDLDEIMAFMGAIRQALKGIIYSHHSEIVPHISEWYLDNIDLNIDIEAPHWLQLSNNKLQVKHYGHLFRQYIKSLGGKTVFRLEKDDSGSSGKRAIDYLRERLTIEGMVEKQLALEKQLLSLSDGIAAIKAELASMKRV